MDLSQLIDGLRKVAMMPTEVSRSSRASQVRFLCIEMRAEVLLGNEATGMAKDGAQCAGI